MTEDQHWIDNVDRRLDQLRILTRSSEDADQQPLREETVVEARAFILRHVKTNRPSIFSIQNGNLRLLWDGEGERSREQIGLQFLGNDRIQFVLFIGSDEFMGQAGSETVAHLIKNVGLDYLY